LAAALSLLLAAAADPDAINPPEAPEDAPPAEDAPLPPADPPPAPMLKIGTTIPAREPLVLDADGGRATFDCRDRDVLIHGARGAYLLINGCHGVFVQGDGNRIDVALQPGARIAVGGADVVLHYLMVAPGPPPVISVSSPTSSAVPVDRLEAAPPGLPR
jgi:hypothetical protein